jgi:hypothetical protein
MIEIIMGNEEDKVFSFLREKKHSRPHLLPPTLSLASDWHPD